jgi:hypothetical protein
MRDTQVDEKRERGERREEGGGRLMRRGRERREGGGRLMREERG